MNEPTAEYAVRMTDGGMHVRNPHPEIERIYPLQKWIEGQITVNRGHVYRRRVIILEDWTEVILPHEGQLPTGRQISSP